MANDAKFVFQWLVNFAWGFFLDDIQEYQVSFESWDIFIHLSLTDLFYIIP